MKIAGESQSRIDSSMEWGPSSSEPRESTFDGNADLVCFSHLRWDSAWQRPQHLLVRCARGRRVFYVEEPVPADDGVPGLHLDTRDGICVVKPKLPVDVHPSQRDTLQRKLVDDLLADCNVTDPILWFYTPAATAFTRHLMPQLVVYDCMDELSAFSDTPRLLEVLECELLLRADVVFTDGRNSFEAKRLQHPNVNCSPSGPSWDDTCSRMMLRIRVALESLACAADPMHPS